MGWTKRKTGVLTIGQPGWCTIGGSARAAAEAKVASESPKKKERKKEKKKRRKPGAGEYIWQGDEVGPGYALHRDGHRKRAGWLGVVWAGDCEVQGERSCVRKRRRREKDRERECGECRTWELGQATWLFSCPPAITLDSSHILFLLSTSRLVPRPAHAYLSP